jgi:hypothetical protein
MSPRRTPSDPDLLSSIHLVLRRTPNIANDCCDPLRTARDGCMADFVDILQSSQQTLSTPVKYHTVVSCVYVNSAVGAEPHVSSKTKQVKPRVIRGGCLLRVQPLGLPRLTRPPPLTPSRSAVAITPTLCQEHALRRNMQRGDSQLMSRLTVP